MDLDCGYIPVSGVVGNLSAAGHMQSKIIPHPLHPNQTVDRRPPAFPRRLHPNLAAGHMRHRGLGLRRLHPSLAVDRRPPAFPRRLHPNLAAGHMRHRALGLRRLHPSLAVDRKPPAFPRRLNLNCTRWPQDRPQA